MRFGFQYKEMKTKRKVVVLRTGLDDVIGIKAVVSREQLRAVTLGRVDQLLHLFGTSDAGHVGPAKKSLWIANWEESARVFVISLRVGPGAGRGRTALRFLNLLCLERTACAACCAGECGWIRETLTLTLAERGAAGGTASACRLALA